MPWNVWNVCCKASSSFGFDNIYMFCVLHVKAETSVAEDDEMLSDRHVSCQVMVTHGC